MPRLQRPCALLLCALTVLFGGPAALAWKPSTHLSLAQTALEDALDDGKVTIYRVNYETGEDLGPVGEYAVDELTLRALREHREQFLAGVLGPDAYPDIYTGQTAIHPPNKRLTEIDSPGGSDEWLRHLWDSAERLDRDSKEKLPARAFTIGFLAHAAGDNYAHTFVNHFAGGPFAVGPNALKHIVLEGYLGKRAPGQETYGISAAGTEHFILDTLVRAESDMPLMGLLKGARDAKAKDKLLRLASVPMTFSVLRAELKRSLGPTGPENEKRLRKAPRGWSGTWANYKREWIALIDAGLKDWVHLSENVSRALFYNDDGQMDLKGARKLVEEYNKRHLKKMTYGPFGRKVDEVQLLLEETVPAPVRAAVRRVGETLSNAWYGFLKAVLRIVTGKSYDDLKRYYLDPERYVGRVLTVGCRPEDARPREGVREAVCIDHAGLDKLLGVTHGGKDTFDYKRFAPAYNTVVMTKLLLLGRGEVDRLLRDLGATAGPGGVAATMGVPNVMLGFNRGLDDDNQWFIWKGDEPGEQTMALVRAAVYDQLFKRQVGETSDLASHLKVKSALYGLGEKREPAPEAGSRGRAMAFERGRVYWSPGGGVRVMQGPILAKWEALGGPDGRLGFPVSDPLRPAGEHGGDWHQFFEGGAIYWRAADGAALVLMRPEGGVTGEAGVERLSPAMRAAWAGLAEPIGPPVSDELAAEGGDAHDRYQFFADGLIYLRADANVARVAYRRPGAACNGASGRLPCAGTDR